MEIGLFWGEFLFGIKLMDRAEGGEQRMHKMGSCNTGTGSDTSCRTESGTRSVRLDRWSVCLHVQPQC